MGTIALGCAWPRQVSAVGAGAYWTVASEGRSLGDVPLDQYPEGRSEAQPYREGGDPLEIANWLDSVNYTISRNWLYGNLWIQGGPRVRVFFPDNPQHAPALNKIPLVRWDRQYTYVSSTHMLLPRGLNLVYDEWGGEKASGCLLHAKFLDTFEGKCEEELERGPHYANNHAARA